MRRVIVTGGAGFIGAHLVGRLVRRGDHVRVVDNFVTGTAANLSRALAVPTDRIEKALGSTGSLVNLTDHCELIEGDVRDTGLVEDACQGAEVVFHQAALRSVPRSVADPVATHDVNVTGTLRILEAARKSKVRRIVFASSSSVYGDTPIPKHEGQIPQPKSPYGASKLAAEAYCQAFSRVFGLSTLCLRYFNVFGPWQDPASEYAAVIPKFIRLSLDGEPLPIHGDGLQSRDFTYVDNVVDANLAAADADVDTATINIGAGTRYSLMDLIEQIKTILGRPVHYVHEASRPGDVRHTQADISLASRSIGYQPEIDFQTGLRSTIEAMQKEREAR